MSDIERFHEAVEKLLADRSPVGQLSALDAEEQRMLRLAQLLRGHTGQEPSTEFVAHLRARLAPSARVSRRAALLSAFGSLAAGVAAGLGLERVTNSPPSPPAVPLVGAKGRWVPVADVSDLPEGTVKAFTAGAVQGFLIHRDGQIRGLSRICTHMGCLLRFASDEHAFVCPCHGAEFNLHGDLRYGPGKYGHSLPPLPPLDVRVTGHSIEVWSV